MTTGDNGVPTFNYSEFLELGTATLFEAATDARVIASSIRPVYQGARLCGPAYPVIAPPGDNLSVHRALAEAPAGSVLVVATNSEISRGFWGEVMTVGAISRRVCGLVTDGAVRDVRAIRQRNFPVFAAGIAIPGTVKQLDGPRSVEIEFGGTRIAPGDIVVGDDDGVVVLPRSTAAHTLISARQRAAKEAAIMQQLELGALTVDLLGLRS